AGCTGCALAPLPVPPGIRPDCRPFGAEGAAGALGCAGGLTEPAPLGDGVAVGVAAAPRFFLAGAGAFFSCGHRPDWWRSIAARVVLAVGVGDCASADGPAAAGSASATTRAAIGRLTIGSMLVGVPACDSS